MKENLRFIISGGGTGGHISLPYPLQMPSRNYAHNQKFCLLELKGVWKCIVYLPLVTP